MKAHVCCVTQDIAPRLHNLVRLAELAELDIQPAQMDILAEMNSFNIKGRYPHTLSPPPSQEGRPALYDPSRRGISMVDQYVLKSVRNYLKAVQTEGVINDRHLGVEAHLFQPMLRI